MKNFCSSCKHYRELTDVILRDHMHINLKGLGAGYCLKHEHENSAEGFCLWGRKYQMEKITSLLLQDLLDRVQDLEIRLEALEECE
ncbi:hypothetical protein [Desulfotomaculum copahuensis]|uniref:Uncharacterized protein n=1 Tax=Desulfotomaculum copahuensis TaxID=1838280 RepID=A0A1B7LAG8_9FIRM|nr:hypothetical protein [Desulfotomaculum copahuensis]OAT79317.1 hypothetical protein A6M21_16275 [Desulfotomaculum copahuensis]